MIEPVGPVSYPDLGMKRIYMDVCCLNRPFDDQCQLRVHLEGEAVLAILMQIEHGIHEIVSSDAILVEVAQNPDAERQEKVRDLLRLAKYHVDVGAGHGRRASELCGMGLG